MIEIKNVNKYFDGFKVLDNMNMKVEKGSIYGLVGVNGSGKTTLLKHLTGVFKPDSGEITIEGEPVFDNPKVKSEVAYIIDDLLCLGLRNLEEWGKYYSSIYPQWNGERFSELIKELGLNPKNNLSKFSKGMKKQAAFALAMSTCPKLLVLDEPLDGLDPLVRRKVTKHIVDDVAEREMTVVISSHNLREIESLCDTVGIISEGNMQIEKEMDELKSDVCKIQAVFKTEPDLSGLNVLVREKRGSVDLMIIRGDIEATEDYLRQFDPLVLDILPLSLEEVFIYEAGGENDEFSKLLF